MLPLFYLYVGYKFYNSYIKNKAKKYQDNNSQPVGLNGTYTNQLFIFKSSDIKEFFENFKGLQNEQNNNLFKEAESKVFKNTENGDKEFSFENLKEEVIKEVNNNEIKTPEDLKALDIASKIDSENLIEVTEQRLEENFKDKNLEDFTKKSNFDLESENESYNEMIVEADVHQADYTDSEYSQKEAEKENNNNYASSYTSENSIKENDGKKFSGKVDKKIASLYEEMTKTKVSEDEIRRPDSIDKKKIKEIDKER